MKDAPKIEFPCEYPIKVIGYDKDNFRNAIADIIKQYCPEFDATRISVIDSRNGKYVSLRFAIFAQGEKQLQELFLDLKTNKHVKMVL